MQSSQRCASQRKRESISSLSKLSVTVVSLWVNKLNEESIKTIKELKVVNCHCQSHTVTHLTLIKVTLLSAQFIRYAITAHTRVPHVAHRLARLSFYTLFVGLVGCRKQKLLVMSRCSMFDNDKVCRWASGERVWMSLPSNYPLHLTDLNGILNTSTCSGDRFTAIAYAQRWAVEVFSLNCAFSVSLIKRNQISNDRRTNE